MSGSVREAVSAVRANVGAELEHELVSVAQRKPARIARHADAVSVQADLAAEAQQARRPQRLAPGTKEIAQARRAFESDDTARVDRPEPAAAARAPGAPELKTRAAQADCGGDDDDTPAREELDMHPRASFERRPRARPVGSRSRLVARANADRDRQQRRRRHQERREHPHQRPSRIRISAYILSLFALALLAATIAAGTLAPAARADGDPASDYLLVQKVFFPIDTNVPAKQQARFAALVEGVNRGGFTLRVALIASSYDMGSVSSLFRRPRTYAHFLAAEILPLYKQRLLVVMPNGFGFNWPKHPSAAENALLAKIVIKPGSAGLLNAARTAVQRLASAAGVKVAAPTHITTTGQHNSDDRLIIIAAAVTALLLAAGARVVLRRRR